MQLSENYDEKFDVSHFVGNSIVPDEFLLVFLGIVAFLRLHWPQVIQYYIAHYIPVVCHHKKPMMSRLMRVWQLAVLRGCSAHDPAALSGQDVRREKF
jgi:hypothetical protein